MAKPASRRAAVRAEGKRKRRCACCGHSDERVLSRQHIDGGRRLLCANCNHLRGKRVLSLTALKLELERGRSKRTVPPPRPSRPPPPPSEPHAHLAAPRALRELPPEEAAE